MTEKRQSEILSDQKARLDKYIQSRNRSGEYEQAQKTRARGVMGNITENLLAGEMGIGQSIKRGITDTFKAKVTGIKQKFDPLNIAKMFGGRMAVGLVGNMTSRSSADMQFFGGKTKKSSQVGTVDSAFYTNIAATENPRLRKGDNAADVAIKIYSVMKKDSDEKKLRVELENDRRDDSFKTERKQHKEVLKALKDAGKKGKERRAEPIEPTEKPEAKPSAKPVETKPPAAKPAEKPAPAPAPAPPAKPAPAPAPAPAPTARPAPSPAPAPAPTARPTPSVAPSVVKTAAKVAAGAAIGAGLLMPSESVAAAIDSASKTVGIDKSLMYAMAKQESAFDPSAGAKTSSAKGLYQFIKGTWNQMVKTYGSKYPVLNKGPEDPEANAVAGALFIKENSNYLSKAGIPIDATSIYAAHFLGPAGAKKLFTADPTKDASEILPDAAKANDFIFYDKTNGKPDKNKPRTAKQVIDVLFEKVGQYQKKYSDVLAQKETGQKLSDSSVQNSDMKGSSGQTTIIQNNSSTNVIPSGNKTGQVISTGSNDVKPNY
jgi:outer membrane biosynthesis protein TonB